ncbi:MAG: type II toxin-antitoxin system RelE/ParE family toxin [Pseudomonadota bacterium]
MVEIINKEVKLFHDSNGKAPFVNWLEKLDNITRRIIENRMTRLSFGNYGDYKTISQDIFELRFHIGSGYRVYFAEDGDAIVILLLGGDKKTQKRDIEKAKEYYDKYKRQ